jgi:hypothetical protein
LIIPFLISFKYASQALSCEVLEVGVKFAKSLLSDWSIPFGDHRGFLHSFRSDSDSLRQCFGLVLVLHVCCVRLLAPAHSVPPFSPSHSRHQVKSPRYKTQGRLFDQVVKLEPQARRELLANFSLFRMPSFEIPAGNTTHQRK